MQVFTAAQIQQLNITAQSAWDALVLIEDAFCHTADRVMVAATCPQAIRAYRLTWGITRYTVLLMAAAAFYSGVLARHGWDALMGWADGYVASCEAQPFEVVTPPAEADPWELPTETICLLTSEVKVEEFPATLLLPPAPEPAEVVDVQPKPRTRKTATKKTTTRKTGRKAKAKPEKAEV